MRRCRKVRCRAQVRFRHSAGRDLAAARSAAGRDAHHYVFQVFALDCVPRFESRPGRAELLEKIKGHVIAKGQLVGTYERA